jgi:hypothetical protein
MTDLAGFQRDLAARVLAGAAGEDPGLSVTIAIQRSWCRGRAAQAAMPTLMLLPPAEARRLLDAYVAEGGGRTAFGNTVGMAFLRWLIERVPQGSAAAAMCVVQMAAHAAAAAGTPLTEAEAAAMLRDRMAPDG